MRAVPVDRYDANRRPKVRIALVGSGAATAAYGAAIGDVKELKAVASCDLSRVQRMLCEECPDAVVIATPPNTHRDVAERALAAGCAVLCEMPFAPARPDAAAMIAAARAAGRPIAMAAKFQFVEDIVTAERWVSLGAIGTLRSIEVTFTGAPLAGGGGIIGGNGPQAFDLIRAFGGSVLTVRAHERERHQGLDVEATATIAMRCESGVSARTELLGPLDKQLPVYLSVRGTDGAIEAGWKESYLVNAGERTAFGTGYDERRAFAGMLREFAAVVRGDREPQTGPVEALATVGAVEAAYRSIAENSWSPAAQLVA